MAIKVDRRRMRANLHRDQTSGTRSSHIADLLTVDELAVEGNTLVMGTLVATGEVVLGEPLSSVLATDDKGVLQVAPPWNGDEGALSRSPAPPFIYAPGQKSPVRIEDGGTGLVSRPQQMQVLVGINKGGGQYVPARLVAGHNVTLNLTQRRAATSVSPSFSTRRCVPANCPVLRAQVLDPYRGDFSKRL